MPISSKERGNNKKRGEAPLKHPMNRGKNAGEGIKG
jgi:hypothetical protein